MTWEAMRAQMYSTFPASIWPAAASTWPAVDFFRDGIDEQASPPLLVTGVVRASLLVFRRGQFSQSGL